MARIKHVGVRLSAAEFLRVALAAKALNMRPATWVRHQAIRAADPTSEPPAPFHAPPPPSPEAKLSRTAATRFTDQQFEALAAHALACAVPIAAFIRQVVIGVAPVARRPLAHAAIVAINRIGNNLNQLVHLAHTGTLLEPDLRRAVTALLAEIHALRDALLDAEGADLPEPPE
jgi:hypothetical protein